MLDAAALVGDKNGSKLPEILVTDFKVVHGSGVEGYIQAIDSTTFGKPRRARFGNPVWASEIAGDMVTKDAVQKRAGAKSDKGDITAALVVERVPENDAPLRRRVVIF